MLDKSATHDYSFRLRDIIIGAQMLFVAFGALVLVPILTGLNPNVALFTAGAGTLLFQLITRGQVPIFLASSFAFIAPICYATSTWGLASTMGGLVITGLGYIVLSAIIKLRGIAVIERLLPPIITGPVIMVIGLNLAPIAVGMAYGRNGGGDIIMPQNSAMLLSGISLLITVLITLRGTGILRLLPILCGIASGYIVALFYGLVDFEPIASAPWFAWPQFTTPTFELAPILFMLPVIIAPAIEHFGDILAIGSVTGRDYLESPGVHRTILGDGLATSLAAFLGGPPNTTYSEVTGAVALTRMTNPGIMTWTALVAIAIAFIGKIGAVLQTIPMPVMGGIMVLLFGNIAVVGLNTLVRNKVNLLQPRNMVIVALVLVSGLGGMHLEMGAVHLSGVSLAGVLGVVLNLLLPRERALPAEQATDITE
ncbi:MAG: uracil-xanthine permease family protein [Desulfuromonas sp.]|nr:uracil-xanthine permease family protein [Desulfuromonas sp.]